MFKKAKTEVTNSHEAFLSAIADGQIEEAKRLVLSRMDLNVPCCDGASILFPAVLTGSVSLVRLMLEQGADPNFRAEEPAATIYHEKPLLLARQASFLMDEEKYRPIVKLLEEFGATEAVATTGEVQ